MKDDKRLTDGMWILVRYSLLIATIVGAFITVQFTANSNALTIGVLTDKIEINEVGRYANREAIACIRAEMKMQTSMLGELLRIAKNRG